TTAIYTLSLHDALPISQLRVHADGREPRDGVHLVDEHGAARSREKKVDPRHAGTVDRLEGGDGQTPDLLADCGIEHSRDDDLRSIVQVLRFVVVELARRDH